MKTLAIEWRHFESGGQTCERCADTGEALNKVVAALMRELETVGVEVTLTETRLPASAMDQSNLLLFNGIPLENLLDEVEVSTNYCASCSCLTGKDTNCRILVYHGKTYEDVPAELICQAALKALK